VLAALDNLSSRSDCGREYVDIREIFKEVSEQLLSEFRRTSGIHYAAGKGDLREDAFRKFLEEYLPTRYGVGRGQVITPANRVSGQLDIVIYDPLHCPRLIASASHSIYPVESVYGSISMKSHLDSEELKDGYQNIASLKAILPQQGFSHSPSNGMMVGMARPMPVTGIIAYGAKRSLEAIAAQVQTLDEQCSDISLRPDFVAVIGQGIVAPREPLRHEFNHYQLPSELEKLAALRKTGRHTLLRLYMQILRELNALTLRPLDLHNYDDMPRLVGQYRVGKYGRFVMYPADGSSSTGRVVRLTKKGIEEIVSRSNPVTLQQHMANRIDAAPADFSGSGIDSNQIIFEYNPKNLPPVRPSNIKMGKDGGVFSEAPAFQPIPLEIDGKNYAVDVFSLADDHLEDDPDFTVDELMSS
jgi:hypothetical protein